MEKIIKETTDKLINGTITKDEADKILLGLFCVIKRNSLTKIGLFTLGIVTGIIIGYTFNIYFL